MLFEHRHDVNLGQQTRHDGNEAEISFLRKT